MTLSLSANQTADELVSLMMLSPLVIGTRLAQFCMSGGRPTAGDRREASRMIQEKMQAASESIVAMNVATVSAMMEATLAVWSGSARHVNDADAIAVAGLLPFSSRVRANRLRLSR